MKKPFGWIFALIASLTTVSAFAVSDEAVDERQDEVVMADTADEMEMDIEE